MSEINFSDLKSYDGTVSEAEFNRLVDVCARLVINNGVNYTVKRSVAGTVIQPKSPVLGAGCPFSVVLSPVPGDPTSLTVTIRPGTVNQMVAGNAFDSFTISNSGVYYVKVGVETDGSSLSTVTYYVDDAEPDQQVPTPNVLPSNLDILIALIKDGRAYSTIACGSIQLVGQAQFQADKTYPVDPGQLPYDTYYAWVIQ